MKQKPILISLSSYCHGAGRYVNSLRNLENSVDLLMVDFLPYIKQDVHVVKDVYRLPTNAPYPGHLDRFLYLPWQLIEDDRWYIFTDTSDVVFQAPIPDLNESGYEILVSCENVRHCENFYWVPIIQRWRPAFNELLPRFMYCFGTWAMKGKYLCSLKRALVEIRNKVALENREGLDQLVYNRWLMKEHYYEHPGLFCTLYDNFYKGHARKDDEGRFWQDGHLCSVVHGNGSSKSLMLKC